MVVGDRSVSVWRLRFLRLRYQQRGLSRHGDLGT